MQRMRFENEESAVRPAPSALREEETELSPRRVQRSAASAEVRRNVPLGIAQGALAAWVMTELGRIGNPLGLIDGRNGWLLYAALGGISGFAAATGRRNTAWTAAGMATAILISPPLLDWLLRVTDRLPTSDSSQSALVLVAALLIGAFTWLRRTTPLRAAWMGALSFFVIDWVFNIVRIGPGNGIMSAAWVSAEHGFLVGGALSLLRVFGQQLLDWRTRFVDGATEKTLEWLRSYKS